MKKLLLFILAGILIAGCTEMTVDVDKISSQVSIKPSYVIAVAGDVNLNDMIQPNDTILEPRDTILFDDTGLMKIFFYRDSIINITVDDFYDGYPDPNYSGTFEMYPDVDLVIEESIDIDPGNDIELTSMKIITGELDYTIVSSCDFPLTYSMILTSVYNQALQPVVENIVVGANTTVNGTINLNNTLVDFALDSNQPYNRILISGLAVPGGTGLEQFGEIDVDIDVGQPDWDYLTGYFGMQTEGQESDTIDLDLGDLFTNNTNAFYLSEPAIRINYLNSFGFPMQVVTDVVGINNDEEVNLNRAPEDLMYPTTLENRELESTFVIDNSNSNLSELVSMFPNEFIFGGSATTNPSGNVGPDNIVFSDSRLIAGLEVELPMIFWMNNLVLSDTIDNFLMADDEGNSPLDMLEKLELRMFLENGFPMGGNILITLYDSSLSQNMSELTIDDFFDPAPVDANGVVTSTVETSYTKTLSEGFIEDAPLADKMIISFAFHTTGYGSQDVKIMSDYILSFRVGLLIQAGFETYLNSGDDEE